ncbi:hypothetical protein QTN25_009240 [Entamoeba marina]
MGKSKVVKIEGGRVVRPKSKISKTPSKNVSKKTKTIFVESAENSYDWEEFNRIVQNKVARMNKKFNKNVSVEVEKPKESTTKEVRQTEEINQEVEQHHRRRVHHRTRNRINELQEPRIQRRPRRRLLGREEIEALVVSAIWSLFVVSMALFVTFVIIIVLI